MAEVAVKEQMETWQIQIPGVVRVWVSDRRHGGYTTKAVNGNPGKGPKRITLSRDEREYNQELVPQENLHLDPFSNGTLARVEDGKLGGDLTDEALANYLDLDTEDVFLEAISEIDLELTHRRLLTMAAQHGRMWQVEMLRDLIEDRYPVPAAGTQRTVREMFDDGEFGSTRLS